jgi:Predicted integral membrane protein
MPLQIPGRNEANRAFIVSRIFLILITLPVICIAAGKPGFPFDPHLVPVEVLQHNNLSDLYAYLLAWWRWDTLFYVRIASQGYTQPGVTVFFPLWPCLIRVLGYPLAALLPGEIAYFFASILLSNLFFWGSLHLLYNLAQKLVDPATAKITVWLLAFFPYTIFFSTGYTESAFLFFCLATFCFLQRGRVLDWWLASACAGLAATTRETGMVIVVPIIVFFLQRFYPFTSHLHAGRWEMLNALCSLLLIPLGVIIYLLYLYRYWADPFIFLHGAIAWGRHPTFPFAALFSAIRYLITFTVPLYNNLLDLCFTILPIYVLIKYRRYLPLVYKLFAWALLLYSLSTAVNFPNPLMSIPRYLMVIFPCCILYAIEWKRNAACHNWIYVGYPLLLAANMALFAIGRWVA